MPEDCHIVRLGQLGDVNRSPALLGYADRRRHVYLVGKTGTGKTTLIENLVRQDLDGGQGLALLDPHGDMAVRLADDVPPWRVPQVVYLDPSDLAHPFGLNPLAGVAPDRRDLVAAQIVEIFAHIWGVSAESAPRLVYLLTNSLRLLLDAPGSTLLGLPRLLIDERYRRRLIAHCRDPVVRRFWEEEFAGFTDRYAMEANAPIQNKIGTLLTPTALRNILGQPRPTLDVRRLMDDGQVLIVNLAEGRLGAITTQLIGALLTTTIAQAAMSRTDMPEHARRDFTLYADEFQHFATQSFAKILSEARKYRLSLVLANQYLSQLPDALLDAVLGNAGTLVCFRVGARDAPLLADELAITKVETLPGLANYTALVKLMAGGEPREAHVLTTDPPPATSRGSFRSVRNRSRATFTRRRGHVEARIARFLGD